MVSKSMIPASGLTFLGFFPGVSSAPPRSVRMRQVLPILRQRALTFSTFFGACHVPFLVVVPRFLPFPVPGPFLDLSFPMCRESTVLVIRNALFSTGCFFIISSGSSRNRKAGSSGPGLRIFPADRQGCRLALSRLRQSEVLLCPDPVSALPGGTSSDVFLQDPRVLPFLPRQEA